MFEDEREWERKREEGVYLDRKNVGVREDVGMRTRYFGHAAISVQRTCKGRVWDMLVLPGCF